MLFRTPLHSCPAQAAYTMPRRRTRMPYKPRSPAEGPFVLAMGVSALIEDHAHTHPRARARGEVAPGPECRVRNHMNIHTGTHFGRIDLMLLMVSLYL